MSVDYAAIREITIKNFRCIDDLHLSFLNPQGNPTRVVVLAGPNGCGKTSVLEAILLANRNLTERRSMRHDTLIECEVAWPRYSSFQLTYCLGDRTQVISPSAKAMTYFSSWRTPKFVGSVGITVGKTPAARRQKVDSDRLQLIKQFLVNAKAHDLFANGARAQGAKAYERCIQNINRCWQRFYPKCSFAVEPASEDPSQGFDLFLKSPGIEVPIDELSSGQLELLMFVGSLVIEDSKPGIILIDEPELHLDPQWHRFVLQTLLDLRPQSQIIVATHSPEIYDSVASYERHFLVPQDDPRAALWQPVLADAGAVQ